MFNSLQTPWDSRWWTQAVVLSKRLWLLPLFAMDGIWVEFMLVNLQSELKYSNRDQTQGTHNHTIPARAVHSQISLWMLFCRPTFCQHRLFLCLQGEEKVLWQLVCCSQPFLVCRTDTPTGILALFQKLRKLQSKVKSKANKHWQHNNSAKITKYNKQFYPFNRKPCKPELPPLPPSPFCDFLRGLLQVTHDEVGYGAH